MPIRKASYSEVQFIMNHSLDVLKEATLGHVEPSWEKALHMVSPALNDSGYYLLHIENNVIQGWIGVGMTFDFYTDEMVGVIPELYVLPAYRKQKVAEKLCKEACKQLQEEGYKKVQLNVFSGNHAKYLYQKLGFHEVSTMMERDLNK